MERIYVGLPDTGSISPSTDSRLSHHINLEIEFPERHYLQAL
jgi:hypothetical protein